MRMHHYEIDVHVCRKCGVCKLSCPREAIVEDDDHHYVIDQAKCIMCGTCAKNCKLRAVMKKLGTGA